MQDTGIRSHRLSGNFGDDRERAVGAKAILVGKLPSVAIRSETEPSGPSSSHASPCLYTVQYSLPSVPNFMPSGPRNAGEGSLRKTLPKLWCSGRSFARS